MKLNLKKLTENLFYLFVFLLPWQTRWIWRYAEFKEKAWEAGTMALFGTEILLWIIFFLTIFINRKNYKLQVTSYKLSNQLKLIILFIIYIITSVFWALNKNLSFYYLLHFLEAVGVIYLLLKLKFDYKKLFYVFFASAVVQGILAVWQFFTQRIIGSKWLGTAEMDPFQLGVSVVGTELRRWLRAYGSLSHPNIFGSFLAIGFLIGVYLIINFTVENKKQLYQKMALIFAELIILIGLLLSFSRGSWVSLFLTFIVFIIFNFKKFTAEQKTNLWRVIIYSVITAGFIIFLLSDLFLTRIQGQTRLEKRSNIERVNYYKEAWQIIKQRPLIGVGLGNYTLGVHNLIDAKRVGWNYQPVHNIFVLILAELGTIGLALFIAAIYFIFKKISPNSIFFYLLLIVFLTGIFDHYWWTSYFGIILWGLILGGLISVPEKK